MQAERTELTLSPYDILDVPYTATETEIKKTFRKKSLLIHPDKFQHERGPEVSCLSHSQAREKSTIDTRQAFDLLKKAEGQLSDPISRKEVDAMVKHARTRVLKVYVHPISSAPFLFSTRYSSSHVQAHTGRLRKSARHGRTPAKPHAIL